MQLRCFAYLDGFLIQIKVSSSSETGTIKAYFSGHYQSYGINVQAACDYECRLVYAALDSPGGANDIASLRKTKCSHVIHKLALRKFVICDNAFACSEKLLNPFSSVEKDKPAKNEFNFYLSQLRISIEQTFGIMTAK